MKIRKQYICPFEVTHDITRGKWKPTILWTLRSGGLGLANLEREIVSINQKMLLEHLRELVEFGLISRKREPGYPLRVEYKLTPRGHRMLEALTIMQQIGMEIINAMDTGTIPTKMSVMDSSSVPS